MAMTMPQLLAIPFTLSPFGLRWWCLKLDGSTLQPPCCAMSCSKTLSRSLSRDRAAILLRPLKLGREVRVNFFGWIPIKTIHFVNKTSESFRRFLGRLRMILCYWKTFPVPNQRHLSQLICLAWKRRGKTGASKIEQLLNKVMAWQGASQL